jgi:hypothetical protein
MNINFLVNNNFTLNFDIETKINFVKITEIKDLFFLKINVDIIEKDKLATVILSNFCNVPNSNFLLKIQWEHSTYHSIVLLLKIIFKN